VFTTSLWAGRSGGGTQVRRDCPGKYLVIHVGDEPVHPSHFFEPDQVFEFPEAFLQDLELPPIEERLPQFLL